MNKEIKELIVLSVIVVAIILGAAVSMATHQDDVVKIDPSQLNSENEDAVNPDPVVVPEVNDTNDDVDETPKVDSFTGMLVGLDASQGLTDVIMVGNFNAETNEVKIISVPRDLQIDFKEEPFKTMKNEINTREKNDDGDYIRHLRVSNCKLTEFYLDMGMKKEALYDLQNLVEEITGLEIDYMAVIDVNGFVDVVDAIGGIDFYVPQRMHKIDRAQDLYIDLHEGMQHLDGEHAMELVRYRDYKMGDLQRIQVQQDFITAVYEKLLQIRDFDTITNLVTTVYNIFDADFGLNFALDYAQYFFEIQPENLINTDNMITIPSYGSTLEYTNSSGEVREKSIQIWYQDEAKQVVQDLLKSDNSGDDEVDGNEDDNTDGAVETDQEIGSGN